MTDNHGTTTIDFSDKINIDSLTASSFKSQDEAVLTHLTWVVECLQKEVLKFQIKSSNDDPSPAV